MVFARASARMELSVKTVLCGEDGYAECYDVDVDTVLQSHLMSYLITAHLRHKRSCCSTEDDSCEEAVHCFFGEGACPCHSSHFREARQVICYCCNKTLDCSWPAPPSSCADRADPAEREVAHAMAPETKAVVGLVVWDDTDPAHAVSDLLDGDSRSISISSSCSGDLEGGPVKRQRFGGASDVHCRDALVVCRVPANT